MSALTWRLQATSDASWHRVSVKSRDFVASKLPHAVVEPHAGQHIVGAVHTQTIDSFWSLIERGIMESAHKVSRTFLQLYVAGFQFSGTIIGLIYNSLRACCG